MYEAPDSHYGVLVNVLFYAKYSTVYCNRDALYLCFTTFVLSVDPKSLDEIRSVLDPIRLSPFTVCLKIVSSKTQFKLSLRKKEEFREI